jgi:4-diphosphocytidyl-2-C-methyl-D-erythritol kinase
MNENKIKINAYAKINLHLDVTEIRSDGYHNIQSIMQSISLCDFVEIELIRDRKIIIECDTAGVPLDEKNIAYKAASRFFERAGIEQGAIIKIEKNIPMAAGLAGGSADGAAVLVGLNKLCGNALDENELYSLGASLGADIPFCISCGCCFTGGIGDKLFSIDPLSEKTVLVIACGGEGVSTPVAYRMLDEKYNNFVDYIPKDYKTLTDSMAKDNGEFYRYIFNIFEEPISGVRPAVSDVKAIMLEYGAEGAMMSGSGPSAFGVFKSVESAKAAVDALKKRGYFASVAFPTTKRKL